MATFDNLYVRHIHFHGRRRNDSKEVWGSGKPTSLPSILRSHTVLALLVVILRNPTSQDMKKRTVVPLQEILRQLPTGFQNGMLSWLVLTSEKEPSSVIIHTGIERSELTSFARSRLIRIEVDNVTRRGLDFQQMREFLPRKEEREELATTSTLGATEPIAHYLR